MVSQKIVALQISARVRSQAGKYDREELLALINNLTARLANCMAMKEAEAWLSDLKEKDGT